MHPQLQQVHSETRAGRWAALPFCWQLASITPSKWKTETDRRSAVQDVTRVQEAEEPGRFGQHGSVWRTSGAELESPLWKSPLAAEPRKLTPVMREGCESSAARLLCRLPLVSCCAC